ATLYPKLKAEIPAHIGVMTYRAFDPEAVAESVEPPLAPGALTIAKPARYQDLQVDNAALNDRFIASLDREVNKAKRLKRGLEAFSNEQLLRELRKRSADYQVYDPDENLYDQFVDKLHNDTIDALQAEVDALTAELAEYKMAAD